MLDLTKPAISLKRLDKKYKPSDRIKTEVHAVKHLTLDIKRGEVFALLGPNGSGKSTTINILTGLVIATGGTAEVFGMDVVRGYKQVRSTIGVVPQEVTMDPFFTVGQALDLQAGLYGVPKPDRWNMELLDRLSLTPHVNANPRQLSGGMKRRLLVAKALVHKPAVLVLDEPTAGVDVELRRSLWAFVRELNKTLGMTILLTTHHMEEAEELADRIGIIMKGELKALDTLANLKTRHGKESLEDIYLEVTQNGVESAHTHV
ncbi:MAG TPA: ABC transporter ATP-binding protein [Candidatus Methylomirabilis sp.]|nr:ABC transporter ATP-binding protein [Candidatus Methylomirabilis sp.]